MKKLQLIAVLILSVLFVVSCVSDDDDDFWGDDQTDTYSGGNYDDNTDTSDSSDTTDDHSDSGTSNSDTTDTGATDTDHGDTGTNTDPDTDTDTSTDTSTDTDTGSADTDTDTGIIGPTEEEKCLEAGGTWSGTACTKEENCGDKPENTEWNGTNGKFTQTLNGTEWMPAAKEAEYGEGECGYKCADNYFWNDTACVDPCKADPCVEIDNATPGSCEAIDAVAFICGCVDEYHWENGECASNSRTDVACVNKPDHADWNTEGGVTPVIDQNWVCENDECGWSPSAEGRNGTETEGCYFSCNENYGWIVASEIGKCLQECSLTSEYPCKDSSSTLVWSARSAYYKTWSEAKEYCENLEEGGYPKGTWQLPTINDLRTIIVKCTYNMPEGSCGVRDDCVISGCYDNLTCNNTNHSECKADNNSNNGCGSHSKLCETGTLWSSSAKDNNSNAWIVKFSEGNIGYTSTDNNTTRPVRCVIK